MKEKKVLIGCAGWSLNSLVASSFPMQGTHLERYAQVFTAVEINTSFYREHQIKTYRRWASSVPQTFRFSVKMPRTITHEHRLREVDDLVDRFIEQTAALEEKLGCLLVQLPPSLSLNIAEASWFFKHLRQKTSVTIVCEPRHASWFNEQGRALLMAHDIAYVQADPPPVSGIHLSDDNNTLYVRLHGTPKMYFSSYDASFITTVADRIQTAKVAGHTVWCIFDNTARGHAIPNALSLLKLVSIEHN